MFDLSTFPPNYFGNLFLVFVRIGAMLFSAPLLNGRSVPQVLKVGLAMLLAFLLVPLNQAHFVEVPMEWLPLSLLTMKELGVGIIVGFVANLVFSAMQLAGQFIGLQIGFSLANVLDPLFSQSISILDQLYTVLAGLIFLAIDGHHMLILAIQQTLDIVPAGTLNLSGPFVNQLIMLTSGVFVAALRIALPVVAALLLSDIALGLMSRTLPQMNVFIVGMPVKLFVGFLVLLLTLPSVNGLVGDMFKFSFVALQSLMKLSAA
ncbi:MAG: flagellar type III secretion system protein FliR [Chloroflexi bacterium]|nr:flagellar type III secretion system protein FliR [Chloroflexota bacterium]